MPTTLTGLALPIAFGNLTATLDRQQLADELALGRLTVDDMIEALTKPGRDPRSDLPPPIFRKDVVKFEDLAVRHGVARDSAQRG